MKREEKNALSRQRILEAAMEEFSQKGYEGASLNVVCAEKGISKGIIYHYFKDKDELYLLCVERCFDALTQELRRAAEVLGGSARDQLQGYFDARLRFFAGHPYCLGIFAGAVFSPPAGLSAQIAQRRRAFDQLNAEVLTKLLESQPLREGLKVQSVVEDFRMYMDYFNLHFKGALSGEHSVQEVLGEHEQRCHRQLDIVLYGVLEEKE